MIRIGILSGDNSSTESIKLIQQFKDFKITGIAQNTNEQDTIYQQYTIEDLVSNSDATYFNLGNLSVDLIQMGIKKSNHLFLKQFPKIQFGQIRQLSSLVDEAGSSILLFNPFVFQPELSKLIEQLNVPHLINIRVPLFETALEHQLQDLILFLVTLEKLECKKIEVFAFEGSHKSSLIHIHLYFPNGSLAEIHLGAMFSNSQSVMEFFPKDAKHTSFPMHQSVQKEKLLIEKNALIHFIRSIQNKPAISVSLSELELAISILDEIKKKLNYLGYSLLN